MFLFAHDEYRTRRMAHDAFGCAAQHRVLQAGVAMSGYNNQVHLQSTRSVADLLEWFSEPNQRFLDQTRFDRLAFAKQIELCPEDPGNPVVLREQRKIGEVRRSDRFDDVKQSNFRAKLLGERQRITERFPGGLGKVDRHKDGFQFEARGRSFAQRTRADSLSQHAHTGSALHPTSHLRNFCFHRRTSVLVLCANLGESANEHYTSVANHRPFFDRRGADLENWCVPTFDYGGDRWCAMKPRSEGLGGGVWGHGGAQERAIP